MIKDYVPCEARSARPHPSSSPLPTVIALLNCDYVSDTSLSILKEENVSHFSLFTQKFAEHLHTGGLQTALNQNVYE